jgi:hypothetical protein
MIQKNKKSTYGNGNQSVFISAFYSGQKDRVICKSSSFLLVVRHQQYRFAAQ